MNDWDHWNKANDAFLAAALRALRLRLTRLAGTNFAPGSQPSAVADDEIQSADDAMRALSSEFTPALLILCRRLGLSTFEQQILMFTVAMELDPNIAEMCSVANGSAARPYPTFGLCFRLFDCPAWDAMSPARPLRRLRLIELNQPGATPLVAAALRADERIVHYVKGLNDLDERVVPLTLPLETHDSVTLVPSHKRLASDIRNCVLLSVAGHPQQLPLLQLAGADSASKHQVARHVASSLGIDLLRLPAAMVPSDFTDLETLLQLWDREHRLLPLALYVDAPDGELPWTDSPSSPINCFLARVSGIVFLDTSDVRPFTARRSVVFDVAKPTALEQREVWTSLLGEQVRDVASQLVGQFSLNTETIQRVAESVQVQIRPVEQRHDVMASEAESESKADGQSDFPALWNACRRATRPRLDALAQRIDARATWDDLVLPPEELQQLHEIANQLRHRGQVYDDWGFRAKHNRGLGVTVLFAGESGTGKTMAAEVIANALHLDIFRVDLSAVVNKYIGETEKALRRLFDAADDGGVILFFDEADALFGKRIESPKDSLDRFVNSQVNFLLQKMESYRGLAILATNLKNSLDSAFLRRLRFVVNFPVPDTAQRLDLWRKVFPPQTPLASLDLDRLARFGVTGGNIHTIAMNAAFASAEASDALSMPHILNAARAEYRKLQKPINAADFRWSTKQGAMQ